MDIYIKPVEKVQIIQKREVYLQDVSEVFAEGDIKAAVKGILVFRVPSEEKKD